MAIMSYDNGRLNVLDARLGLRRGAELEPHERLPGGQQVLLGRQDGDVVVEPQFRRLCQGAEDKAILGALFMLHAHHGAIGDHRIYEVRELSCG